MNKLLLGSDLLALPFAGQASDPFQKLSAYFVNTEIEANGGEDDGSGFGISGAARVADQAYVLGEYQSAELDDSDVDVDQLRAGVGFHTAPASGSPMFYGQGEFVSIELDDEEQDGFGVYGGILFPATEQLHLYGELGYLTLDDLDGLEFSVGGAFDITPNFGLFAEYRLASLEDDNDDDGDLTDVKLGVSLLF